ncbi:hypothetical protein ACL02U_10600 [Streptomyces sp. MS06]|uniref:hypothetical protein n=1 Tax=Streptomyces sp. MS06 TaxID=3385974 RepID=UPI0039A16370
MALRNAHDGKRRVILPRITAATSAAALVAATAAAALAASVAAPSGSSTTAAPRAEGSAPGARDGRRASDLARVITAGTERTRLLRSGEPALTRLEQLLRPSYKGTVRVPDAWRKGRFPPVRVTVVRGLTGFGGRGGGRLAQYALGAGGPGGRACCSASAVPNRCGAPRPGTGPVRIPGSPAMNSSISEREPPGSPPNLGRTIRSGGHGGARAGSRSPRMRQRRTAKTARSRQ